MPDALMVSSSFLPGRGGIESYLSELCDELAPRLAVLAAAKRDGKTIPTDLGYPTAGYKGSMLWPTRRVARAIVEEARRQGTDRVLFGTPWPLVLLGPRLRRAGLSYAVIVHGAELLVPSVVPFIKRRLAHALSEADLLLTVSEFTRGKLREILTRHNKNVPPIELLRARVDLDRFRPEAASSEIKAGLALDPDQPMVLHFGRLVRRKGADRLIKAMPEVRKSIPDAGLVVAGTGPELKRLRKLADKVQAPVVFAGRVTEEEAPAFYATADVFALPVADRWFGLDIEGLGVVLLEASAAETPAVTGNSGGTPEAVIDGRTGYVIDAKDESALVRSLTQLLGDAHLGTQMGKEGREHVAEEFTKRPLPQPLLDWLQRDGAVGEHEAKEPRR